jgi:RNA-splicing ligase RtcB
MIELKGKFNTAKVFTDNIENEAISQIINLCNQEYAKDSVIAIMPDVHAGAGCTIGTTMTITDKVCPNLVGVDIGCGVIVAKIKKQSIDFAKLDRHIRQNVPSGFDVRAKEHSFASLIDMKEFRCIEALKVERMLLSIGTLGGGNHYIEMSEGSEGELYLSIHTGSRNLGKQVAEFYQKIAVAKHSNIEKSLAYLEGQDFKDYMHDMLLAQKYARLNREAILDVIAKQMGFVVDFQFETIHNFIERSEMGAILRKGAVSAYKYQPIIIPMNMRDGSLICIGKGNVEWNFSAPHGAGRILSRSGAKREISLADFKKSMEGIWTTSVQESTIDESPMAYKPMEEIIANIGDTVEIKTIIKPIYNFKAS